MVEEPLGSSVSVPTSWEKEEEEEVQPSGCFLGRKATFGGFHAIMLWKWRGFKS